MGYRIALMGSPDFALPAFKALLAAGHDIVAVYSQPPRPAQRGQKLQKTPIHQWAEAAGLLVKTPKSLRKEEAQKEFADLNLDLAIVAAYGLILPKAILEAPRLGCINIHASLLPRWRGAAPIHRALLAGDKETGITIMQMDEGLDTGAMLSREAIKITNDMNVQKLHDELANLGAKMIVDVLADLQKFPPTPQPEKGVTYADKIQKDEARIDWTKPAFEIDLQIRGMNPWPGAFTTLDKKRVKILSAAWTDDKNGTPGEILDGGWIAASSGAIFPKILQREGGKAMAADDFWRGLAASKDMRFS